jgi:hypothetical protein
MNKTSTNVEQRNRIMRRIMLLAEQLAGDDWIDDATEKKIDEIDVLLCSALSIDRENTPSPFEDMPSS